MTDSEYKYLKEEKIYEMIEACYRCGDCRTAVRPAVGRYKVCPVREAISAKWEPFFARGKIMLIKGLLNGDLTPSQRLAEIVYQCTICGSCQSICNQSYHPQLKHPLSQLMNHPQIWEALRAELWERGFRIKRHNEILDYCEKSHNPYFEKHSDRTKWIPEGKKFPDSAEYILYTGCTEPYRYPDILKNMIKILDKAQLSYTILGENEWCCGSIALRTGNTKLAKQLADHNYEEIKKLGSKKIITHCAGCYRTLKIDYPNLIPNYDLEIFHITEIIDSLIKNNQIQFDKEYVKKVTYHDPCHLGRHAKLYDPPREIIKNIPGIEFVEMYRNRENAWCCGAGGGVKSGFPDLALKIAQTRINDAIETEATEIVTACPFCINNLKDAVNNLNNEKQIEILDILELILKSIK